MTSMNVTDVGKLLKEAQILLCTHFAPFTIKGGRSELSRDPYAFAANIRIMTSSDDRYCEKMPMLSRDTIGEKMEEAVGRLV